MRMPDVFDHQDDDGPLEPRQPRCNRCNRCGSTDVRWRQQTGKWVLFSMKPGVEHVCASSRPDADAFDVIEE